MLRVLPDISTVFIIFRGQRRDRILAVSKSDSSRGIQGYRSTEGENPRRSQQSSHAIVSS